MAVSLSLAPCDRARFGSVWVTVPPWPRHRGARARQADWPADLPVPTREAVWDAIFGCWLYQCDPAGDPVFCRFDAHEVIWRGGLCTRLVVQWTLGDPDACGLWAVQHRYVRVRAVWVPLWARWIPQIELLRIPEPLAYPALFPRRPGEGRSPRWGRIVTPPTPEELNRFGAMSVRIRRGAMALAAPAIWL